MYLKVRRDKEKGKKGEDEEKKKREREKEACKGEERMKNKRKSINRGLKRVKEKRKENECKSIIGLVQKFPYSPVNPLGNFWTRPKISAHFFLAETRPIIPIDQTRPLAIALVSPFSLIRSEPL